MSGNLALDLRHMRQRLVPARFQFASDQSVGRIGGIVLAEGAIGGIARRLEIAVERLAHLIPPLAGFSARQQPRRRWRRGRRRSAVPPRWRRRRASRRRQCSAARHCPSSPGCSCSVESVLRARVAKRQLAPAAAAADQPGQQGVAVLGRAVMAAGGDIAADHCADRLGLLPADIALMGVRHQRQPFARAPCGGSSR